MDRNGDVWAVVLAGGEGRRVRERLRGPDGPPAPKQFCRFEGSHTLLDLALERARRLTSNASILTLVMEHHRRWWESELAGHPRANVLSQPADRGTGIAILHALMEVLIRDPVPLIVLLPSDHVVDDEDLLQQALAQALGVARERPDEVVVLGMPVREPDPDYGWIVPTAANAGLTRGVMAFEEKPAPARAAQLVAQGALVNSFIVCATGWGMLDLFERTQPGVVNSYTSGREGADWKATALRRLFLALPSVDFGLEVLARALSRLRVLPVPPCGWTDLGTPERLARHESALSAAAGGAPGRP
jgi:mannose-1-phosphate guanylyltransferase